MLRHWKIGSKMPQKIQTQTSETAWPIWFQGRDTKAAFTDKTISAIHKRGRDMPLISDSLQVETTAKLAAPAQINH